MQLKLFLPIILAGCASTSKNEPAWIHAPARSVDNGYLVYVAKADAPNGDRAQFKAEGLALEDLANECSLIPKGTRIEDRFIEEGEHKTFTAFVKIGLEFQVCESAKKTVQPEEIKSLASFPFSEQLRKYQDLVETGEMPTAGEMATVNPPEAYGPAPIAGAGMNDNVHFFATRQYIAYQKQVVIFAPPTAFATGSSQSQTFVTAVTPPIQKVQMTEQQNPSIAKQSTTWSTLRDRPQIARPQSLSHANRSFGVPMRAIPRAEPFKNKKQEKEKRRGRRRRQR